MSFRGTTVTFYRRSDGMLLGYRSEGHTGYAQSGTDIVCAMVSALTQTTLNGLRSVLKAPVMFEIDEQDAFLEARFTPEATEAQIQQGQLLLVTLLEGLQAVTEGFPKYVRILFQERR